MEAQQPRLDWIANDISNIDTPGFQSERVGFESLLYNAALPSQAAGVTVGGGAQAVNLGPSQTAGVIQSTGQPLDMAISGSAYFEVKEPGGASALTRDGQFELDAKGRLTTVRECSFSLRSRFLPVSRRATSALPPTAP